MRKHLFTRLALAALLSVSMYAFAAPTPTVQAAKATTIVLHSSGATGYAAFIIEDGDITRYVEMDISTQRFQEKPGNPISEPTVFVYVSEYNSATQTGIWGTGQTTANGLQIDGKTLSSAYLPWTTVSIQPMDDYGNQVGSPYDISVTATWTGVGVTTYSHWVSHYRIPGVVNETDKGNGAWRDATAVGSYHYTSPFDASSVSATDASSVYAQLSNGRIMQTIVLH